MQQDPIRTQEEKVAELESQLQHAKAMLEGMRLYATHVGEGPTTSNKKKKKPVRRMRLGSKKRVVFQFVANGYSTVAAISELLEGSEIDQRNVRDIVRDGISKGDLGGDIDDKFVLTEFGKELLEKASKEDDWDSFKHLLSKDAGVSTITIPRIDTDAVRRDSTGDILS